MINTLLFDFSFNILDNLDTSRDSVVKVTIHDETGSLNRILKAFRVSKYKLKGPRI